MEIFDKFGLVELKKIFYVIQKKYNVFPTVNLYGLNKYDITSLLMNTKMFYRDSLTLIFNYGGEITKFAPNPRKCYYRGPKVYRTHHEKKSIVLDFS